MSGVLHVYGLGSQGVNVDRNPLNLEDGELTKAQNAIHDPTGSMGGIRKRPGLTKVNSSAVSGSVFGIVNVPIAPITTRRFLVGVDQDVTSAYQWITSTDAFSNSSTATTPGACSRADDAFSFFGTKVQSNRGVQTESLFLYPGDYTRGDPQPIRAYDGTVDRELFRIPLNAKAVEANLANYSSSAGQVMDWVLVGTKAYFVSLDFYIASSTVASTVFEYDFETGALTQIGEGAGSLSGDLGDGGVIFTCLTYHQGYLYAGVGSPNSGGNSTASGVYRIRPGVDTTWTYDYDNSGAADADHITPACMASYKGLLYVGMTDLNSTSSAVMVRSTAGAYASSTTVGNGNGSGWTDMIVFGDDLYACAYDNNGASSVTTIRKFDGSSWSTVHTIDTGTATPRVGIAMVVHNSRIYVLAINTSQDAMVAHSSDGSTWVEFETNLDGGDITSIFGVLTD